MVCYFTCAREALEAPRAQLALQADVTPLISKTLLPFGRNETTTPFTKPRCGCSFSKIRTPQDLGFSVCGYSSMNGTQNGEKGMPTYPGI